MIAIILAGGISRRLHPITLNEPKCLLRIGGQTMLSRYISILEESGISKTLIVTGFNHEAVMKEAIAVAKKMEVVAIQNTRFAEEDNHPIDGFLLTKDYIESDFLLLNSDIYFSEYTIAKLIESKKSCVAIDSSLPFIDREMFVNFDKDMGVTAISKSLAKKNSGQGKSIQITKFLIEDKNTLFHRVEECVEEGGYFYPAQAYDTLIEKGKFFAVDIEGEFSHELDTHEDFDSLTSKIKNA